MAALEKATLSPSGRRCELSSPHKQPAVQSQTHRKVSCWPLCLEWFSGSPRRCTAGGVYTSTTMSQHHLQRQVLPWETRAELVRDVGLVPRGVTLSLGSAARHQQASTPGHNVPPFEAVTAPPSSLAPCLPLIKNSVITVGVPLMIQGRPSTSRSFIYIYKISWLYKMMLTYSRD